MEEVGVGVDVEGLCGWESVFSSFFDGLIFGSDGQVWGDGLGSDGKGRAMHRQLGAFAFSRLGG